MYLVLYMSLFQNIQRVIFLILHSIIKHKCLIVIVIKLLSWQGITPINSLGVLLILLLVSEIVYLMRRFWQKKNKTAL